MRILRRILGEIDYFLLVPVLILITLSLSALSSIDMEVFRSQTIFLIFSIVVFLFFTQININMIKRFTLHIYVFSIIILTTVLFVGVESHGASRWIEIFGVRLQFSEILKPFLAVGLAHVLSSSGKHSFPLFTSAVAFLIPLALLIFLQPDLGNALIYGGVVFLTLLVYGFPFRYFILSFIAWLATLPIFWFILHDYQRHRILTFFDPSSDPLGRSYNSIQAIIAVGSGGFLGKGLGQGTQSILSFLPEHHTDFIFATISEEFGFVGSSMIVLSFAALLYRMFVIYREGENQFAKILTITAFFIIFVHFFVNIGMNVGLVPVVGVTLPFVSSGGSSLLSNFILLGLIVAVSRKGRRERILEIG